nr:NADH dehydrogenase subunit 6 [Myrsidea ptilorhynchi]
MHINLEILFSAAPLMMSWGVFVASKNLMVMLVSLLFSSLALPLMFMESLKLFWPCGLLLILMSTGLIVVFAYIVSLHSSYDKFSKKDLSLLIICFLSLVFSSWSSLMSISSFFYLSLKIKVEILLSLLIIYILLFLVVNFVRLVYSKGGGFRKKF